MSSLFFTPDERQFFEKVLETGLHDRRGHFWWVIRFALAQSLRMELPIEDRFGVPPAGGKQRSELELVQITGVGKDALQDYDDSLRLMLGIRHQEGSEARRVGKVWLSTCSSRWSPYHKTKKSG